MSELLGLGFNYPVNPSLSFHNFLKKTQKDLHGWGLAFYPDRSCHVIKEPFKARKSHLAKFIQNYPMLNSNIFIANVQRSTRGQISYQNTHPFQREFNGLDFVFVHNGNLSEEYKKDFVIDHYKPVGETDSEAVLCHLLNRCKDENMQLNCNEDFRWLLTELRVINDYGNLNCIFADGKHLFIYYDERGYKGLFYILRKAPYDPIQLLNDDYEINLEEEKNPYQRGYIIATQPLTDEEWLEFGRGELTVIKNGEVIFRK